MNKLVFGFKTRSNTNQVVQSLKMDRSLQFWISEVEGLHYPCSKNNGTDQLHNYPKTICVFVFVLCPKQISHDAAHFFCIYFFKKQEIDIPFKLVFVYRIKSTFVIYTIIFFFVNHNLSHIMRKLAFCKCKNKGANHEKKKKNYCELIAQLISAFVFSTKIVQSFYLINLKFQTSSHLPS